VKHTVKGQVKKSRDLPYSEMKPVNEVHILAVALDYTGYPAEEVGGCGPLTCTPDVERFLELGQQCGVPESNIVLLKDNPRNTSMWPDRDRVLAEARKMAEKCDEDDTFIFFYAGHGDTMADDDFADSVNIIVITDCCHSGTICDLDTGDWGDKWICHLAAVQDYQCAVDLGKGGAFTSSLLEALQDMVENGQPHPALCDVYNAAQAKYGALFSEMDQDFSFNTTPAVVVEEVAWPFYPEEYNVDTALDDF